MGQVTNQYIVVMFPIHVLIVSHSIGGGGEVSSLSEVCTPQVLLFFDLLFWWKDLELMAKELDRESDRQSVQAEAESQRRQMLRWVPTEVIWILSHWGLMPDVP